MLSHENNSPQVDMSVTSASKPECMCSVWVHLKSTPMNISAKFGLFLSSHFTEA